MARAPFDLRAGETVSGYRVEKAIGRGGSATVYQAVPVAGGPPVALKIMHEHDPSGVGRKRFARESALLQKLQHPHVVRMFDVGYTERDLPFIVFELLNGRSLKGAVQRTGAFAAERVGRITLQLLDALVVAHDMGIIHRDIKPGNVFLSAGHEHDHALLLDLGLAKALEGDGVETHTITGTGYRLGTPRYMSPEMARGDKAHAPGDLYAIGLLMAEMLDGEPVVQSQAQIDILLAHANPEDLQVSQAVKDSPFHGVIRRALAKDLKIRYRTAVQMRADVEGALALYEKAMAVAAELHDVPTDLAPTLNVDRGQFGAMMAQAQALAEKARAEHARAEHARAEQAPASAHEPTPEMQPPPDLLGGTIDMASGLARPMTAPTMRMDQLPPQGLQMPMAPPVAMAPPAAAPEKRSLAWLILLLVAVGAVATAIYYFAER